MDFWGTRKACAAVAFLLYYSVSLTTIVGKYNSAGWNFDSDTLCDVCDPLAIRIGCPAPNSSTYVYVTYCKMDV